VASCSESKEKSNQEERKVKKYDSTTKPQQPEPLRASGKRARAALQIGNPAQKGARSHPREKRMWSSLNGEKRLAVLERGKGTTRFK